MTIIENTTMKFIIDADYINYAWGFQHNGVIMTEDGVIRKYRFNKEVPDDVRYKLKNSTVWYTLPQETIDEIYRLLSCSRPVNIIEENIQMYDAGLMTITGYLGTSLERIQLSKTGDNNAYNNNPCAVDLVKEIKFIFKRVGVLDDFS